MDPLPRLREISAEIDKAFSTEHRDLQYTLEKVERDLDDVIEAAEAAQPPRRPRALLHIESFGYLHGDPGVRADHADYTTVVDLRDRIRDPHVRPEMRQLTGLCDDVYDHVMATPGAPALLGEILFEAGWLLASGRECWLMLGCQGGRHRSVALARAVAHHLAARHIPHHLVHRDVLRPVVAR